MQKPRLELSAELTLEEKIMTELAVLEEQIHNLVKHVDVLTEEIKNLKGIQQTRVEDHEKRIFLLEEKVSRQNWIINLVTGIIVTGIVGGLLSLILK